MITEIAGLKAEKNSIQKGVMTLGSIADGSPINLPFYLISGKDSGPTVWLNAGIHGDEFGGTAAVIEFAREINTEDLKGQIVALPVANPPSFVNRHRTSWIDGVNINRIFPGSPKGSYSYQLAKFLSDMVAEHADYYLDLHSGGLPNEVPLYAAYNDDGSELSQKAKELCERVGADTVWRLDHKLLPGLDGTTFVDGHRSGVVSVLVEAGGGASVVAAVPQFKRAINSFMQAIGALPGEAKRQSKYTRLAGGSFVNSTHGGLFMSECKAGDTLPPNGLVGRIINLYGDVVEEVRSPYDRDAFITAVRNRYFPMHAGELCAEVVPIEGTDNS